MIKADRKATEAFSRRGYGSEWVALRKLAGSKLELCSEIGGRPYWSALALGRPGFFVAVCFFSHVDADIVDYKSRQAWPFLRQGVFAFGDGAKLIPDTGVMATSGDGLETFYVEPAPEPRPVVVEPAPVAVATSGARLVRRVGAAG